MANDLLSTVRGEIEARMRQLRPLVAEYEQMLAAAVAIERDADSPAGKAAAKEPRAPASRRGRAARERAPRGAAQHAIIAALEHGSHTVSELAVVTAMSGANVRENLGRLLKAGTVTRARRDGKAAYALSC